MIHIHFMNLNSLDLNLLVALDALLLEANVSRAAMRIGLSQPAVSHALQRLREALGDPLLVRVGARMELTPRAQAAVRWRRRSIRCADFSSLMISMPSAVIGTSA
jgi:DNA-binding transcriptional LysR family regulator